jgi:hypothetical protein
VGRLDVALVIALLLIGIALAALVGIRLFDRNVSLGP